MKLTKLEYFAGQALAGLAAQQFEARLDASSTALWCIEYAEAMIETIDKVEGNPRVRVLEKALDITMRHLTPQQPGDAERSLLDDLFPVDPVHGRGVRGDALAICETVGVRASQLREILEHLAK